METGAFCSPEITKLALALISVQRTLQPATKDRENPFVNSKYATLNSVLDTCRDALLQNGLWVTQFPVPAEQGNLGLVTKITHAESGQWQSSLLVMPLPKHDPQGYGSALTYARRYAISAMLGMVTEEDDDANKAAHLNQTANKNMPKRDKQKEQPSSPDLPKLDGVHYTTAVAQDGRTCVMATGNTLSRKDALRASGFRWDPQKKAWWRYAA